MKLEEVLICGYFDDIDGEDYFIEVNNEKLKQWVMEDNLDYLDYDTNVQQKIKLCSMLEKEFTKNIKQYRNFSVIFC